MAHETTGTAEMVEDPQHDQETRSNGSQRAPERAEEHDDLDGLKAERERLKTALAKANKEAADRRRRLDELEAREKEAEEAKLSEADRIRKAAETENKARREAETRSQQLERDLVETRINHAVILAAMRGETEFTYPDIAPSLIDRARIEYDAESGKITGVEKELERILKSKPGLAASGRGGGTPPRQGPTRTGTPTSNYGGGRQAPPNISPEEEVANLGGYF